MSACGKILGATALSLVFSVAANAQAPETEKNVSMRMALMIIDGALEQCSKDGYKFQSYWSIRAVMSPPQCEVTARIRIPWNLPASRRIPRALWAGLR